jgi:hypothetical protein
MIVLGKLFFPDYLQVNFSDDRARAEQVLTSLSEPPGLGTGTKE